MTKFAEFYWPEAKTFGILQKREEMSMFVDFLLSREKQRDNFLEIGTAGGGVASILLRYYSCGYSIDMLPCWNLHRLKEINENFHQYAGLSWGGMTYHYFKNMNIKFDLLFIDGAHDLNSAMRDFTLYSEFVAPGGIVAFHDIVPDNRTIFGEQVNVRPLWQLLKNYYQWYEFISTEFADSIEDMNNLNPAEWGGIGCIIV